MPERMVQVPVDKEVRDLLKEKKGMMSYSNFLKIVVSSSLQEKPTTNPSEDSI